MGPYIFIYLVSTFFIMVSERFSKKNEHLKIFFVIISLLCLAAFFGLSNVDVGADKLTYANKLFMEATNTPLKSYLSSNNQVEIGYAIFTWIIGIFTENIHWFYFVYSLCVSSLIYISLKMYKNMINLTFAWFLFLVMIFPVTMCLFRQGLAVALVSYATSRYIIKDKFLSSTILIFIAMQFHSSAILGVLLMLIIWFLKKENIGFKSQIFALIIVGLVFLYVSILLPWLYNVGDRKSVV